jgi:signal transduction histidine kinase
MHAQTDARSGWRPWLWAGGLWLALATVTVTALWHLKREAVDGQGRELHLLSLALTDGISRGLRGADAGLRAMRAELGAGRLPDSEGPSTASLHTRAGLMPLVETLWLLDSQGRTVAASDSTPAPDPSTFWPPLDQLDREGSALSRAFKGSRGDGPWVAMAVRQADPGKVSGGWIVAALSARELMGGFGAAVPSAGARIWVLRGDGVRLASVNAGANTPSDNDLDVATAKPADAAFSRHLDSRPGVALRRFPDGSDNLVEVHRVPQHDVELVVSRDMASGLKSWREAAELAGTALILLLGILAAAVHFVQRANRRRAEAQQALRAQVSRASKLEALGTLAGGVAHDFNNVLAGIVGYGEMAHDAAVKGSDQERHLNRVLQAALRGKALVERILAFSRGGARSSSVFHLEPVVEEVITLLSASLPPGIVLDLRLNAAEVCVRGDPTQAFEAVMNLGMNAMQAMQAMQAGQATQVSPRGGVLGVQLQRLHTRQARVLSHSKLPAGEHVCLTVTDQGGGITPEVMEHLFEPFFTTRAAQSGTGMGLAVVFGAVAEFGGAIDVTSQPGRGACFALYLPVCTEAALAPESAGVQVAAGRGQRLLVVDDEAALVALAVELLTGLGYQPSGFTDPTAALQAVTDDPAGFAAVITDELMPGMTGTQLAQALRQVSPGIPVLLVSGFGGALLAQRARAAGVSRVLAKPLQRARLAQSLAELV